MGGHETYAPFSQKKGSEPALYLQPNQHPTKRIFPTEKADIQKAKKKSNYRKRKQNEERKEMNKRKLFQNPLEL